MTWAWQPLPAAQAAAAPGSNDVPFASVETTVLFRRPVLYPARFGPVPIVVEVVPADAFASAQATVSYQRTLLYPSLQQPTPIVVVLVHRTLTAEGGTYNLTGTAA